VTWASSKILTDAPCDRLGLRLRPGVDHEIADGSNSLTTTLAEDTALGGQAGTSSRIENYLGLPRRLATRALPSRRRDVEELLA
jgi:hypothetical protein